MKINRNNCEAFFLDYYEGTLSEQQIAELFSFLKDNADLREVFESFNDVELDTEDLRTPDFSFLKKEEDGDEHEQAAIWMVELADETISQEERDLLNAYLEKYPEKKRDVELYRKTKLTADAGEVFPSAESLRKPVVVSADNFDDFAVALVEGSISDHDKSLLEIFVATHPEYRVQLEQYRKIILPADNVEFEFKSQLRKSGLQISADNIEELIISYLENQLTDSERVQLEHFVQNHPEYKSMLEDYRKTIVTPDAEIVFAEKQNLRKGAILVTAENAEHYVISASEGLLNREEMAALSAFVNTHPAYRKLVEQYAQTRLQPDLSVVYEDKAALKRKDRGGYIWWNSGLRYAAILVILLIGGYFVMRTILTEGNEGVDNGYANNETIKQNDNSVVPFENEDVNQNGNASNNSGNLLADNVSNSSAKNVSETAVWNSNGGTSQKVNPSPAPVLEVDTGFVPVTIAVNGIGNSGNAQVGFSDALYSVVFSIPVVAPAPNKEYISPGQLAMRWMKDKLDQPAVEMADNAVDPNAQAFNEPATPEDRNVDGMDLTESAVNRVGSVAANGNVHMQQREDGTWLQLWNYNVRVGR
jgi:uncharacterized protein YbcI